MLVKDLIRRLSELSINGMGEFDVFMKPCQNATSFNLVTLVGTLEIIPSRVYLLPATTYGQPITIAYPRIGDYDPPKVEALNA